MLSSRTDLLTDSESLQLFDDIFASQSVELQLELLAVFKKFAENENRPDVCILSQKETHDRSLGIDMITANDYRYVRHVIRNRTIT
jgi:hypothetical protein